MKRTRLSMNIINGMLNGTLGKSVAELLAGTVRVCVRAADTWNRFHVIGINYARTLCCHGGSAALDVDREPIRLDRAIRRRDRGAR